MCLCVLWVRCLLVHKLTVTIKLGSNAGAAAGWDAILKPVFKRETHILFKSFLSSFKIQFLQQSKLHDASSWHCCVPILFSMSLTFKILMINKEFSVQLFGILKDLFIVFVFLDPTIILQSTTSRLPNAVWTPRWFGQFFNSVYPIYITNFFLCWLQSIVLLWRNCYKKKQKWNFNSISNYILSCF